MDMRNYLLLLFAAFFLPVRAQHPRLYVTDSEKDVVSRKIASEPWATMVYDRLKCKLDSYAVRHQQNPEWLLSRMAMYWRDGERYTQCWLKNEVWERGEGNAPVPTVRMPGMRIWNKYQNVPLAERTPYNGSGDMWAYEIGDSTRKVLVPYQQSGHLIRGNNVEILTLAEQSAFLYWLTSDEKYGRLAADIFNQWVVGTYYMRPILDPGRSSKGFGGYEPGGILGYYDYEQIHDDLALHGALIYDMAYDYINSHPHSHLANIGKTTKEVADSVFKRFIDIGMVRGGKSGNWNVNGWNMMILPILMLDDDSQYADGHGRSYYLHYLINESTPYHDALPDILKVYDPETGLWPESPGYAFGTINMLTDFALLLKRQGIDIVKSNPIFQKAALAFLPWMDSRANMIVFGDSRGGPANFNTVENLYTYYTQTCDTVNANLMAATLRKGIELGSYSRMNASWQGLCSYEPLNSAFCQNQQTMRNSYSPFHRVVTMRSADDQLMSVVYGGRKGAHLSQNGLALQLYGFGYALAPDAAGYVSYWSDDYQYHQTATGSNTILPGYLDGDITLNALMCDSLVNFVDMSASEKRRSVVIVSTGHGRGYYIDVFRSDTDVSDYLMHIVGKSLKLNDAKGRDLKMVKHDTICRKASRGYDYFQNIRSAQYGKNFQAFWQIDERSGMQMWMAGAKGREIVVCDAPHSTLLSDVTPHDLGKVPHKVPTLIVRQSTNAWQQPFVAVYEPVEEESVVESVKCVRISNNQVDIVVYLKDGHADSLSVTIDGKLKFKRK